MSEKKLITVVGATGAQGGGLVRSILTDKYSEFKVRAVTRDINSGKAQELAKLGAELISADIDDLESIKNAFKDAYGAFCVTFFWAHFSPEKELVEAKKMAQAAKETGLKHVIWSTLEDTRKWVPLNDNRMPTLMGKYKTPHLDAKGEADQFFRDAGIPTSFLLTSFFWDNFIHFGMGPKKGEDGKLAIAIPMGDKKLPGIAAEDIGKCAYGIFKKGSQYIGKTIGIAGEHLTGNEIATLFSKILNKEIINYALSPEDYRKLGFPGAEDLGNMFQFKRDFNEYFCGIRNLKESHSLNPELLNFEQWLTQNKNRIPIG